MEKFMKTNANITKTPPSNNTNRTKKKSNVYDKRRQLSKTKVGTKKKLMVSENRNKNIPKKSNKNSKATYISSSSQKDSEPTPCPKVMVTYSRDSPIIPTYTTSDHTIILISPKNNPVSHKNDESFDEIVQRRKIKG